MELKDFRPISMVGCIYKIIAKILAQRIKKVMPTLIGETQSVFVMERQILDGALVANELVSWAKKNMKEIVLLKLDFQKAYDSISWSFVDHMLDLLGFGLRWREWIKQCLTTALVSVLVNGSPTTPFKMERGLRQGDPLSPFLFVIAIEAYNQIMKRAIGRNLFQGVDLGSEGVNVSHLQFADDTLVYCPAKRKFLTNLRRILDCLQLLSGLKINYSKSALIVLGKREEWRILMADTLGCQLVELPINYLGIPLGANPRKPATWRPVINRIQKRISMWKAKVLYRAGRLVLIQSVLNSIPPYYLSLFKMPKKVAKQIIRLQRDFFWHGANNKKGVPLVKWDLIQKPKSLEGLGVDDLVLKMQHCSSNGGGGSQ